jgi:hypothetical protein
MKLYKHQKEIIDNDRKKYGIFAGCGGGKTRIALCLAKGKTIVICPKMTKLDRTWEREVEKIQVDEPSFKPDMTVISKEELKRDYKHLLRFDTVIVDECFTGDMSVKTDNGYKDIRDIIIGDRVATANGFGIVTNTSERQVNDICIIKLNDGRIIKTTPEHPFYIKNGGWVNAINLNGSHLLMSYEMLLLEYGKKYLYNLWKADIKRMAPWRVFWTNQTNLFKRVQFYKSFIKDETSNKEYEQGTERKVIYSEINKDEIEEPNVQQGNKKKSQYNLEKNKTPSTKKRWEWTRNASPTKKLVRKIGGWVDSRFSSCYQKTFKKISNLLQNRYSKSREKNCNRSRWNIPFGNSKTTPRQEKNKVFREIRVESIEIQKQRGTKVYNLSVSGHPSYFVEDILVHNCHKLLGVSPNTKRVNKAEVPKTSGFYDCLSSYLARTKPERFYPLTASMISNPMRVYAVARLFGKDWNFFEFRNVFYTSYRIPGKYFDIWNVRKGDAIKERLVNALKSLGYVGRLDDWFDVPSQIYRDVFVELTPQQRKRIKEVQLEYADPMTRFAKVHQIESGILIGNEFKENEVFPNEKVEKILEYSEEFGQLIVIAKFTEQIAQLEKELKKQGKNVYTLTGKTKNSEKETLMATVRGSKECILIVQAQVSYGWEFPECQCIVFASRTYNFDDLEQAQGRIQRANNIKKNVYINLITMPEYENINGQRIALNQSDKAVHDCLSEKKDFSEAQFIKRLL